MDVNAQLQLLVENSKLKRVITMSKKSIGYLPYWYGMSSSFDSKNLI